MEYKVIEQYKRGRKIMIEVGELTDNGHTTYSVSLKYCGMAATKIPTLEEAKRLAYKDASECLVMSEIKVKEFSTL